jgi:hypothetical protein
MARKNGNKVFKAHRNRGQHQRRRSSRGGRLNSKLFVWGIPTCTLRVLNSQFKSDVSGNQNLIGGFTYVESKSE